MHWLSSASCNTNRLLLSVLALSSLALAKPPGPPQVPLKKQTQTIVLPEWTSQPPEGNRNDHLSFEFRHVLHHGGERYPGMLRRKDIRSADHIWMEAEGSKPQPPPKLSLRSRHRPVQRLADRRRDVIEGYLLMNRHGVAQSLSEEAWVMEDVEQPNISDKETVVNLARMTADAYVEVPGTEDWMDVGQKYNSSTDFGWEGDGLRGHIFVDSTNSTVIISLKGTSPAVFDGPETTTNDKINDNLLFSCCCARVGYFWKTVCDCYSGTAYHCGKTCLKNALMEENTYYRASLNLYYTINKLYPNSQIWVVGHSLGGAISSLLGMTYGLPVVAFEAPGEALAASRIGLPLPPGGKYASTVSGTYHFGNTADPIFMGTCNGRTSACSIGGYAMETKCHAGLECVYDTVNDLGWRMGLGYHRIQLIIKDILEKYERMPECVADPTCTDCYSWIFEDRNNTTTTTKKTTTSHPITTTTTTCKTPGYWGCLDETTTTTTSPPTSTITTSTITTTTSTCTKYNWYWKCIDKGKTWTSTETTSPTATTTTIRATAKTTTTIDGPECTHKGWFGRCLDPSWGSGDNPAPSLTATSTPGPTDPPDDPWRVRP